MMTESILYDALREGLWIAVIISTPTLVAGLVVGLAIGLIQALTSVQENTLTFVPKAAAMLVAFWVSMSFMTHSLVSFFTGTIVPLIAGS